MFINSINLYSFCSNAKKATKIAKQDSIPTKELQCDVFEKHQDTTEQDYNTILMAIVESGLDISTAVDIASSETNTREYFRLIDPEKSEQKTEFSGKLFPQEAAAIILNEQVNMTDEKIQTFIDLKDITDLSDREILYFIRKPALRKRLLELITPDEQGCLTLFDKDGKEIVIKRPLEAKEAVVALKMDNAKIGLYIELIDAGVEIPVALRIVKNKNRAQKFIELLIPNNEGKFVLKDKDDKDVVLPRGLSLEEIKIILSESYNFTPEIILEQLREFNEIKSRKLPRYLWKK